MVAEKRLTKGLIDVALKVETKINEGRKAIGQDIKTKIELDTMESGIEAVIRTERPIENKPIIYEITFIANMVKLRNWIDAHKNMLGVGIMFFKSNTGLLYAISEKYEESFWRVEISGSKEKYIDRNMRDGITFIVHREVINDHAWIVKCVA